LIIHFFTTNREKKGFEVQLDELWTVDRLWAEAHGLSVGRGLSTIIRGFK
jgi:hypothetical protein